MSASLLLMKFGVTFGKAIYALRQGDPKGVAEIFLKPTDVWLNDLAAKALVTDARKQILAGLEPLLKVEGGNVTLEQIDAAADETFQAAFPAIGFESLVENIRTPERIPAIWSARRKNIIAPNETDLISYHDQLLAATAEALIDLLPKLPKFQNWFVGYVSDKMKEQGVRNDAYDLLLNQQQIADLDFEWRYWQALATKLDRVDLFIERQDLHEESRQQQLTVAYVTLELTRGRDGEGAAGSLPADALLDSLPEGPRRVLIVGPAGCGKTTLLR